MNRKAAKPAAPRRQNWLTDHPLFCVFLIYALSSCVHAVLSCLVADYPQVWKDESIYINLAQSLAYNGTIAFRDQPINYFFLLYPMVLAPLFWLKRLVWFNMFHAIQIWNSMLVGSSVFPVYLLAKAFGSDSKKALLAAGMTALMPDLLMSCFAMSESLIWPLMLWTAYFGCRMFLEKKRSAAFWTALFTALLFFAKPGSAVLGAVLLLCEGFLNLKKNPAASKNALLAFGLLLLAGIGVYVGLYLLYPAQFSLLGYYDKLSALPSGTDWKVILESLLMTPLLFVLACCGVFAFLPFAFRKSYTADQNRLIAAVTVSLCLVMLGTAVMVTPKDVVGEDGFLPLHLRYVAMYIPLFAVFSLSGDFRGKHRGLAVALLCASVLAVVPGAKVAFPWYRSVLDNMALAAYRNLPGVTDQPKTGIFCTVILVGGMLWFAFRALQGWDAKKDRRIAALLMSCLLVLHSGCVVNYMNHNVRLREGFAEDADEVGRYVESADGKCLGLTSRSYDEIYTRALDVALITPIKQVTADQMFVMVAGTDGAYRPFVPEDQVPNVGSKETGEARALILGDTVAEHLELSDEVNAWQTKHGLYTVVELAEGKPWLKSMMYGVNKNTLSEREDTCCIYVFDDRCMKNDQMLLHLTASGTGILRVGENELTLTPDPTVYDLPIDFSGVQEGQRLLGLDARRMIRLSVTGGQAEILSYTMER